MLWTIHIPNTTIPLLIQEICEEEWLSYWLEPEYNYVGYVDLPSGKRKFFKNWHINQNPIASVEICLDKSYCADMLERFWFQVPLGRAFFSDAINEKIQKKRTSNDAIAFAKTLGYPVFIKPNDLSEWTGVMKVHTEWELRESIDMMRNISHVYRIEKCCQWRDYRLVVFEDDIISAYERIPLSIIWDGIQTIVELIETKQKHFFAIGRPEVIDMSDIRIQKNIEKLWYTFSSILRNGERIMLLDNANLSTGGESRDVSEAIHPDFRDIAIRATKSLSLQLCWVDLMTPDITKSLEENQWMYTILELNSSPGLDNYITTGEVQREYIKQLYKRIILEK